MLNHEELVVDEELSIASCLLFVVVVSCCPLTDADLSAASCPVLLGMCPAQL